MGYLFTDLSHLSQSFKILFLLIFSYVIGEIHRVVGFARQDDYCNRKLSCSDARN